MSPVKVPTHHAVQTFASPAYCLLDASVDDLRSLGVAVDAPPAMTQIVDAGPSPAALAIPAAHCFFDVPALAS